jgi:hypothetical protein
MVKILHAVFTIARFYVYNIHLVALRGAAAPHSTGSGSGDNFLTGNNGAHSLAGTGE